VTISYEGLEGGLFSAGAQMSPAELHGMISGSLSAGARFVADQWQREVCTWLDIPEQQNTVFATVYSETLASLQGEELSFLPLLPDDDEILTERVGELGAWCRGFLSGFGMAGRQTALSEEAREVLSDFVEIGKVSDDLDDAEEHEVQLVELTEYLKVGALLVFTEYGQPENH